METTSKLMWIERHLALLSLILFLSSVSIAASSKQQQRQPPKKSGATGTVNLQDYGAIGDSSVDAGPALQQALNDLAAAGGGTLVVPAGHYLLATPVLKQFASGTSLTIQGEFSSTPIDVAGNGIGLDLTSRFIISVGQTNDALALRGLDSLLIKDVVFEGIETVLSDARVVLKLSQIKAASVLHCEFYGLASLTGDGGILLADQSDLSLQQTAFLGCSTNSAVTVSVVQNTSWLGILIRDCKFIDYGLSGFYSKTPLAPPYSWINIGNPASLNPSTSRREAIVDHVMLDEGGFFAISARPELFGAIFPPYEVYLSRLYVNVSNLFSAGTYFYGAQKVFIDRSHFGWSTHAGPAISLSRVGDAILDLIDTSEDATTMGGTMDRLTVINSNFTSISIAPPTVPRIINTQTPEQDPAQYVRQRYLDVLDHDPDPASHFFWTNKILLCNDNQGCVNQVKSALAAFLSAAPPPKFSATGTVVDENGLPLEGTNVSLTGSQAVAMETDGQGNFAFGRLATAGEYVLTPTKNHYSFSSSTMITPTGDQARILTGTLLRHTVSGHIASSTGQDLSGVTVTLSGSDDATATSDDKGNFSFPSLPAGGDYVVSVSRANYDFTDSDQSFLDLSANQTCSFTGTLRSYTISGVVTTAKGKVISGLDGVTIFAAGSMATSTVTDNMGSYSLVLPGDGTYTLAASKTNFQFQPKTFTLSNLSKNQAVNFSANPTPILLSGSDPTRLLALDAVLSTVEPFDLSYDHDWSEDPRTRIVLFATNFDMQPNDTPSDFIAELEDGSHRTYALTVETAEPTRLDDAITRFVVRLNDDFPDIGDAKLRLAYKGMFSEPLLIAIGHVGAGTPN
jgi:hypothetical protein